MEERDESVRGRNRFWVLVSLWICSLGDGGFKCCLSWVMARVFCGGGMRVLSLGFWMVWKGDDGFDPPRKKKGYKRGGLRAKLKLWR